MKALVTLILLLAGFAAFAQQPLGRVRPVNPILVQQDTVKMQTTYVDLKGKSHTEDLPTVRLKYNTNGEISWIYNLVKLKDIEEYQVLKRVPPKTED